LSPAPRSIARRRPNHLAVADRALRQEPGAARADAELRKRRRLWSELEHEAQRPLIAGSPVHVRAVELLRQVRRGQRATTRRHAKSPQGGGVSD
jgi:hypothetical protein